MVERAGSDVIKEETRPTCSGFEAHLTRSLGGDFLEMETAEEAHSNTNIGGDDDIGEVEFTRIHGTQDPSPTSEKSERVSDASQVV